MLDPFDGDPENIALVFLRNIRPHVPILTQ